MLAAPGDDGVVATRRVGDSVGASDVDARAAGIAAELEALPLHDPPPEPAAMLATLASLGDLVETSPRLLALRAQCRHESGQQSAAWDDIRAAMRAAARSDAPDAMRLHRWLTIFHAEFVGFLDGNVEAAKEILMRLLRIAKPDDHAMQAMASHVFGLLVAAGDDRRSLVQANGIFRVALIQWDMLGPCSRARRTRNALVADALEPLGRHREALEVLDELLGDPGLTEYERARYFIQSGFAAIQTGDYERSAAAFDSAERLARNPLHPIRLAIVAWGRAMSACRRGDAQTALDQMERASHIVDSDDDRMAVPFLCDMSLEFGSIGELGHAEHCLDLAMARKTAYPEYIDFARFVLDARRGVLGDVDAAFGTAQPVVCARGLVVAAAAAARVGDLERAAHLFARADYERKQQDVDSFAVIGEAGAYREVATTLGLDKSPAAGRRTA